MKAISFLLTSNLPSKADTVHGRVLSGLSRRPYYPALKESRSHNWVNLFISYFLLTCVYEVSVKVHIF